MDTNLEQKYSNPQATPQVDKTVLGQVESNIAKLVDLLDEASGRLGVEAQEELTRMVDDVRSSIEQTARIAAQETRSALKHHYWQALFGMTATGFALGFLACSLMRPKSEHIDSA